jgi:xylulokinase
LTPRATLSGDVGTSSTDLWTRIVPDITGLPPVMPSKTIDGGFGAALLAAPLDGPVAIADWNPSVGIRRPDPALRATTTSCTPATGALHRHDREGARLAAREERLTRTTTEELQ